MEGKPSKYGYQDQGEKEYDNWTRRNRGDGEVVRKEEEEEVIWVEVVH